MEWLLNLIPFFGNFLSGLLTNKHNEQLQASANQTNINLAREQNASSANQAQLAFLRNNPAAQVQQLQQAGFSRHGAAALLSGAPGYTAAPISSATAQAAKVNAPTFDNNLAASAMQSRQISKQIEMANQQLQFNANEEQRKQDMHIEQLEAAKRQNVTTKYERDSRDKADALFELLKPHINSDTNYKDVSDLVKKAGLQDSQEWKNTNTTSYNMVQDLIKSYQQTSAGAASNVITWNKANRQEFYNSMEQLDKVHKLLDNQKLRFEVEKQPELHAMTMLLESGKYQALMQEIETNYLKRDKELTALDLDNEAKRLNIDLETIKNYGVLARAKSRNEPYRWGNITNKIVNHLVDEIDLIVSPLKGIISIGL